MGFVVVEGHFLRGRKARYLQEMPPSTKEIVWGEDRDGALVFDETSAKVIAKACNVRIKTGAFDVERVEKVGDMRLIFLDAKTHEVRIDVHGRYVRPRAGCNNETGRLF